MNMQNKHLIISNGENKINFNSRNKIPNCKFGNWSKWLHEYNITWQTQYTRILLSERNDNEVLRYRYKGWVSLLVHSPGLVIGTFPGPSYRYSVPIKSYVRINFVLTVNQTRGSCYRYSTENETLVPDCVRWQGKDQIVVGDFRKKGCRLPLNSFSLKRRPRWSWPLCCCQRLYSGKNTIGRATRWEWRQLQ